MVVFTAIGIIITIVSVISLIIGGIVLVLDVYETQKEVKSLTNKLNEHINRRGAHS